MPAPSLRKIARYGVRNCWIMYNNSGVIAYHRVWMTDKCQIKIGNQKIDIAGDGQKLQRNYGYEAEGTIEASVDDNIISSFISAMVQTLPGGSDHFESRYAHGSYQELQAVFVGVMVNIDAEDLDTLAPLVVRYVFPKVIFDPQQLNDVQSMALHSRLYSWVARRTATDLIGTAITGFSGNGGFWYEDVITDSTQFDPDAAQLVL